MALLDARCQRDVSGRTRAGIGGVKPARLPVDESLSLKSRWVEGLSSTQKPRLGELLVEAGLLSESQLRAALAEHRWRGDHLGATLVRMELVSEAALTRALASQLGLPIVSLQGKQIHPDILELVPADAARKHYILPLFVREEAGSRTLFVGTGDPTNLAILAEICARVGLPARPVVVSPSELDDALARFYPDRDRDKDSEPASASLVPGSRPRGAVETQASGNLEAAQPVGARAQLVARALAELLIEKRLIDPRELDRRIAGLQTKRTNGTKA